MFLKVKGRFIGFSFRRFGAKGLRATCDLWSGQQNRTMPAGTRVHPGLRDNIAT